MPDKKETAPLSLAFINEYAEALEPLIVVLKSLKGSGVGTTHTFAKTKIQIGDATWEANLGTWRRLK